LVCLKLFDNTCFVWNNLFWKKVSRFRQLIFLLSSNHTEHKYNNIQETTENISITEPNRINYFNKSEELFWLFDDERKVSIILMDRKNCFDSIDRSKHSFRLFRSIKQLFRLGLIETIVLIISFFIYQNNLFNFKQLLQFGWLFRLMKTVDDQNKSIDWLKRSNNCLYFDLSNNSFDFDRSKQSQSQNSKITTQF
jgi:hypothetical protein